MACLTNSGNERTPRKATVSKMVESIRWAKALDPNALAIKLFEKRLSLCFILIKR